MSSERVRVFKRLETDAEFRARIEKTRGYVSSYWRGAELDDHVWANHRAQRRIIEDER
jgi:hypothetical protein